MRPLTPEHVHSSSQTGSSREQTPARGGDGEHMCGQSPVLSERHRNSGEWTWGEAWVVATWGISL